MQGTEKFNNCLFHCGCGECGNKDYGYQAIINGQVMGIGNMRTVEGLVNVMPDLTIHHDDYNRFVTAMSGK